MQIIGLHGPARSGKDTIADFLVNKYGMLKFAFSDALYREVTEAYGLRDEDMLRGAFSKEVDTTTLSLAQCKDQGFVELAQKLILDGRTKEIHAVVDSMHVPLSPRWVLQMWGTEYRRAQDPDYWVNKAHLFMTAFVDNLKVEITEETRAKYIGEVMAENEGMSEEQAGVFVPAVGAILYDEHSGVVVSGVRFNNEYQWLKEYNGTLWHVTRDASTPIALGYHTSETPLALRTGDKLIQNNSTVERLHTGVALAIQGNDIVNTFEE